MNTNGQPQKQGPQQDSKACDNMPSWCYVQWLWGGVSVLPGCPNLGECLGSKAAHKTFGITAKQYNQGVATNNQIANSNNPLGTSLNQLLQPLLQALPAMGVKVGVFMFALILVIIGFWIVSTPST